MPCCSISTGKCLGPYLWDYMNPHKQSFEWEIAYHCPYVLYFADWWNKNNHTQRLQDFVINIDGFEFVVKGKNKEDAEFIAIKIVKEYKESGG